MSFSIIHPFCQQFIVRLFVSYWKQTETLRAKNVRSLQKDCNLPSPITSKHSTFYSPRFQPLKRLLSWLNGGRHFRLYLAARPCLYGVTQPESILAAWRKTCNWLCILHKASKMYFFPSVIHFAIFTAIIFRVWSMSGSKQHDSREAVTQRFVRSHLDKTSRTAWRHEKGYLAAEYCSKWRQRCRILGFIWHDFHKETLHFRA